MAEIACPGLPGSWLNGWLAAVGATVLDRRIRLHWTNTGTPVAVLSATKDDPIAVLMESRPTTHMLEEAPIARVLRTATPMKRKVPIELFCERAGTARTHDNAWMLSSTLTDLAVSTEGVHHGRFDPPAPKGLTLHDRLSRVHRLATWSQQAMSASFAGRSKRLQANGLGFDLARVGSLADSRDPFVDPILETLAFFGLALFPVRGSGRDERLGHRGVRSTQRGWQYRDQEGERFFWPAWTNPLDQYGIDATAMM